MYKYGRVKLSDCTENKVVQLVVQTKMIAGIINTGMFLIFLSTIYVGLSNYTK